MLEYIKKWFRKNGWECEATETVYVFIKRGETPYDLPINLTEKDKDDFIIFITDNI